MKNMRTVFRVMRTGGLLAILALFLYVEWRFIHGNLANALVPLIQLFAVGSVFLLPIYWVLLAITLIGWIGGRRMDKKAKAATAVEE